MARAEEMVVVVLEKELFHPQPIEPAHCCYGFERVRVLHVAVPIEVKLLPRQKLEW